MKQKIDKLFINGKIYTFIEENDTVESVAVNKGYIIWTGLTKNALEKFDPAEIIDLEGKAMEPSMGDSHLHFYAYNQTLFTVDLGGITTRAEAWAKLKAKCAEVPAGTWVKGSNYDQSKWTDMDVDRMPTADDLDLVSTEHPVIIKRCCLHEVSTNHKALEVAGIGKGYVFGEGGLVELDENGYPNGVIREQASKIFDDIVPDPLTDKTVREQTMEKTFKHVSSVGVTMMDTYAAKIWNFFEDPDVYENLDKKGKLPVRMRVCLEEMYDKPILTEQEKADPYRKVDYGTFKSFTDGSFGARSAALLEDYDDDPGNKGILVISQDALNERIYQAYKHGLQPATHCIGDAGTEACLQAIEYTVKRCIEEDGYTMAEIMKGPKFRVIHAQLVHPDQLERFKKVPVIFDIQPVFLNTDLHWIDERIGSRSEDAYTWKKYLDNGIICTGGSDCPVESYNPWPGIWGAVNRTDPLFPDEPAWGPQEKLSKFQAACLYSKYMAYGNQMERYLGTIEPGKFADMIVTDRDWLNGPDDDILNVKVLKTYLAGDEVYSAE